MKKLNLLTLALCMLSTFFNVGCSFAGDNNSGENQMPPETQKPKNYTVNYEAEKHPDTPKDKIVEEGYELTESDLPQLLKDGFSFTGWTSGEKIILAGEKVNDNMTLSAKWTEWGTVASPTFSVMAGEVLPGTKVELICESDVDAIYFTLDGNVPTISSEKYESPIEVTDDITIKAFAVKSGMKNSGVAEAAYTIDKIPPEDVKDLTVKIIATGCAELTWTNPEDSDLLKIVITYDTDETETVFVADTPNNEKLITGVENGTQYTFTVKAVDESGNMSNGESVDITTRDAGTFVGTSINGLVQGSLAKESWMSGSGNLVIKNTEGEIVEIPKTSEVVVIPTGVISKTNVTSNEMINPRSTRVKLSPFVMSKYEVTRELYKAVMGTDPSKADFTGNQLENPVNYVSYFDAIVFCNKLSLLCGLNPVYSYDFSKDGSKKMVDPEEWFKDTKNLSSALPTAKDSKNLANWLKVNIDISANGYRLPILTEYNFCARGGDPNVDDWYFKYSGSDISEEVAWCSKQGDKKQATNAVGSLKPNRLGIYDLTGNVKIWCNDNDYVGEDINDKLSEINAYAHSFKDEENYYVNPFVHFSNFEWYYLVGGDYQSPAASVGGRGLMTAYYHHEVYGIHLVRSIR